MAAEAERQAKVVIRAVNDRENRWMVEARIDLLDGLLADEFVLVHITGYRQSKAEWLHEIGRGQMEYHDIREQSVDIQIDGTTARLVARNHVDATIWGSRALWRLQMTTMFAEVDGVWTPTHSRATTF